MVNPIFTALPGVFALVFALTSPAAFSLEPLDVLRDNVSRGITILKDPRYRDTALRAEQRARLCEVAHEMFDPYLFSKLALASNWEKFDADEQIEFVDAFADYLCTFYLSKLQERYSDENVVFLGQEFKSESMALVRVEVDWQNTRVPVEIRMALREGRWKAFDAVISGISAVMLYRVQLGSALAAGSPAALIRELREKVGGSG